MTQQELRDALGKLEAAGRGTSDLARELYSNIAELEAATYLGGWQQESPA